jgi:Ras GTPase-activating-like protein IQGAP2/3
MLPNLEPLSSHLLVRQGLAERMGNLLGQLEFSNDQLERTNKGLKDAGVALPNFGNVRRDLAKEMNEEPEEEPETEEERTYISRILRF